MNGYLDAEYRGLSLCRTCIHAEDAGHLTREDDLYICRALVAPLRDYAASETPEYVLVNGCAPACLEHYERDEAVFDALWGEDLAWENALAHPPTLRLDSLQGAMDTRFW